ncbi:MAG: DUF456 domain-containing protein [Chloroflexota bacterium]
MSAGPLISELFFQWITLSFMLVGLVGLLIPIFPGILIIWISALFYAVIEAIIGRMGIWDWTIFFLITLLMIFGSFIDNIIIAKKLRETGTPWKSIFFAYAAGLISSLFLTPITAIFATPLALLAAEYFRLKKFRSAIISIKGWLIGFGWTVIALQAVGLVMIGLWLVWAWY